MLQEKLLEQKIGIRLTRVGMLSKVFAVQTFNSLKLELTPEQFMVLMVLKDNKGMYQRQLGTLTFKDRPNITRIVSILEKGGYIESKNSSNGRQIKQLFITQKGKGICKKYMPIISDVWENTIKDIPEDEINSFIETLNKIENNLRKRTYLQI